MWLALNLRAFMRYDFHSSTPPGEMLMIPCSVGRFSIPLGLVILLLVAIQGECTIKSFVAWLPLYAATVGLITTSVYHVMTKQVLWATGPASFGWDDGAAGDAGVPWPECASTTTAATGQQPQETQQQMMMPAVVARWMREPLPPWAGRCVSLGQQQQQGSPHRLVSPFSEERRRGSSSSGATTLSLSNITGRVRASWGSRVRAFFQDQDHDLDLGLPLAVPVPRYSGDGRDHHLFDFDDDRPTEF